jgi:hypothetical protein
MRVVLLLVTLTSLASCWQRPGKSQLRDRTVTPEVCRTEALQKVLPPEPLEAVRRAPAASAMASHSRAVRLVYLVPKDRNPRPQFPQRLVRAAQHTQLWYRGEVPDQFTFTVPPSVARTVKLEENAQFYLTSQPGADPALSFWSKVLKEMKRRLNATFNDPNNVWVFYADINAQGQRTGASQGIVLIDEGDVTGLLGQSTQPLCRWVGGLAHELGHAFGLSHPAACAASPARQECASLMYTGYRQYPATDLLSTDGQRLRQSPFFGSLANPIPAFNCSQL